MSARIAWLGKGSQPQLPRRGSSGASGFDLCAYGEYVLAPFCPVLVKTGWNIEIDPGFEGQVRPRSGLALKHGITVLNSPGTIDSDYRGEIGAILCKLTHGVPFQVHHGDRIAQLVITPVYMGPLSIVDSLSETSRGTDGYGSTGVR